MSKKLIYLIPKGAFYRKAKSWLSYKPFQWSKVYWHKNVFSSLGWSMMRFKRRNYTHGHRCRMLFHKQSFGSNTSSAGTEGPKAAVLNLDPFPSPPHVRRCIHFRPLKLHSNLKFAIVTVPFGKNISTEKYQMQGENINEWKKVCFIFPAIYVYFEAHYNLFPK